MTSLCHRFPQPYSWHQDRTGWPLSRSVLSTPDTRMVKRPIQPRSGYKRGPLAQNRLSSTSPPLLFCLQLTLATLPLVHLFHLFHSSQESCSSVFVPDVEEKLGVDQKKNSSQAATHDSVFGRARVVSLDVDRDVSLYRRRIMSAISCACAHSSPASSWTAME
jgi:hypothetical protein